jgi:hypothetical protein
MPSASAIRLQIETALAHKIPSALTPAPKIIRPVVETGIEPLDHLLDGGLPVGALTELVGAECSGRTSTALSFLSQMTQAKKVCAWIDVSNSFDPSSAAAAGVDLARLLWVRCGISERSSNRSTPHFDLPEKYFAPRVPKRGLHGGGFGPHPRTEVNGLSDAIEELLQPTLTAPRCAEPIHKPRPKQESFEPSTRMIVGNERAPKRTKPWDSITQALRSTDLILQSGGFGAIVLDMAGLPPEVISRIELSTWHRYRVAAERTQSSILLLSQYPCAKSSSELQLRLLPAEDLVDEATVFTGIQPRVEVSRQRFAQPVTNVVVTRKPPQKESVASWRCRTTWAGAR